MASNPFPHSKIFFLKSSPTPFICIRRFSLECAWVSLFYHLRDKRKQIQFYISSERNIPSRNFWAELVDVLHKGNLRMRFVKVT